MPIFPDYVISSDYDLVNHDNFWGLIYLAYFHNLSRFLSYVV